jgi:hypothetical protein
VARLKFLREARAHSAMLEFRIGDRVTFTPDGRKPVIGILTKYNRKTVTVITETGEHWNVAPGHLRKLREAQGEASQATNVVPLQRD